MNPYNQGDLARVKATFSDNQTNDPVDPSVVTLMVLDATGLETTYTYGVDSIIKDSVGKYRFDIPIPFTKASAGQWRYRWSGTGVAQAANEGAFLVKQSAFDA